jgi:hypothetical protein
MRKSSPWLLNDPWSLFDMFVITSPNLPILHAFSHHLQCFNLVQRGHASNIYYRHRLVDNVRRRIFPYMQSPSPYASTPCRTSRLFFALITNLKRVLIIVRRFLLFVRRFPQIGRRFPQISTKSLTNLLASQLTSELPIASFSI